MFMRVLGARRLKQFRLTYMELARFFETGVIHEMVAGLPSGAKLVEVQDLPVQRVTELGVEADPQVAFVFEHESFPDVGLGVPGVLDSEESVRQVPVEEPRGDSE